MKIIFDPGTFTTKYVHEDDVEDLPGTTGDIVSVTRASSVEFDIETGVWVSRLHDGKILCEGPRRSEVVKKEHEIIEDMIEAGEPIPEEGFLCSLKKLMPQNKNTKHHRYVRLDPT